MQLDRFTSISLILAAAWLALSGCQGSSAPATEPPNQQPTVQGLPGPIATGTQSVVGIWGLQTLDLVESATGELEVTLHPGRFGAAGGDSYIVDVTNFFVTAPCRDCAWVESFERLPGDAVRVGVGIRHPFGAPVAVGARADLHVFDMMGVVVSDAEADEVASFAPDNVSVRTLNRVVNADGYTTLFDAALEPIVPTPNVEAHPYRVFNVNDTAGNYDSLSANGFTSLVAPEGHNVFAMGASGTAEYDLQLTPGTSRSWGFALFANYGQSAANKQQRTTPQYYLPEFNNKAAWRVTTEFLSNDLMGGDPASSANLRIGVRDWQQGATVAQAWEFGTTPKDSIRAGSEISEVAVAIPGVLAAPLTQPNANGTGTGLQEDRTFDFLINNSASAPVGTYYGLVTVTDTLVDGRNIGLDRALTPTNLGVFTTYQLFVVDVAGVLNDPPVLTCPLTATPDPPIINAPATLDVADAMDPDGPPTLMYEWDFDWQGNATDFNPPDATTVLSETSYTFMDATPRTIGVRAVDGLGATSAACTETFTAMMGANCVEQPQFAVQNQSNYSRNFLRHTRPTGYGGHPDMGWNNNIAVSPSTNDVYILLSGLQAGQAYGTNYIQRSADGGCTWGTPVLTATRSGSPPPYDGWSSGISPYPASIGCTADGHPVIVWMEGICWTRYIYGTNTGTDGVTFAAPQTVFVEDWGSYWEWYHHVLPDPADSSRVTIVWRGAKQASEPASLGGNVSGMIRMAYTTNAGAAPTWNHNVLVNGFDGGGSSKWHVHGALGAAGSGDSNDVFAVWNTSTGNNLYMVKWESSTATSSTVATVETGAGRHEDPVILVDNANNPIVIYDADGTGKDIVAKKGVDGFPPTFPNPAVTVNSAFAAGTQQFSRAAHDPATGNTFVVIQDQNPATSQIRLVTLNNAMTVTETTLVNTNDAGQNTYQHVHPHVAYESPNLYVLWQDSEYTYSSTTNEEQWHDGFRVLAR